MLQLLDLVVQIFALQLSLHLVIVLYLHLLEKRYLVQNLPL